MEVLGSTFLRVKTPVTTDGTNTKIVDGRAVYKETHLPISAKKHLLLENANLPNHLHHIIEVVDTNAKPAIPEEKLVKQAPTPVAQQIVETEDADEEEEELAEIPDTPEVKTPKPKTTKGKVAKK